MSSSIVQYNIYVSVRLYCCLVASGIMLQLSLMFQQNATNEFLEIYVSDRCRIFIERGPLFLKSTTIYS